MFLPAGRADRPRTSHRPKTHKSPHVRVATRGGFGTRILAAPRPERTVDNSCSFRQQLHSMPSPSSFFFFARLIPRRADFPAEMTAEEGAAMEAHAEFLEAQLRAGALVVAGPVLDPQGVFGMAVFQADTIEEVLAWLATDPAQEVGRYEVLPMSSATARAVTP